MKRIFTCLVIIGFFACAGCSSNEEETQAKTETETETETVTDTMAEPDEPMPMPVPDEQMPDAVPEPAVEPATQYGPDDIVMAIADRDGNVRLALTPSTLSMGLTRDTVDRLQSRIRERGLGDELKKALLESVEEVVRDEIQNVVEQGARKTLRHRISYPVEVVNSIFFRDGRLWIDLEREKPLSFDDVRTSDGRPVLANFDEADALALVAAFESL